MMIENDDFNNKDLLNDEDRKYIQSTIEKEGFDYAFVSYSDFSEIKNQTFHTLRKSYLKAQSELEEFINQEV